MFTGLRAFLFEHPVRLLLVAGLLQFLLICVWSWRRSSVVARAVRTGFLMILAVVAVSVLVVTDRERVMDVCASLAQCVERGDVPAIEKRLDETFRAGDWDRSAFVDRVRRGLHEYRFRHVRVSGFEFHESKDATSLEVEFDASCRVQGADVEVDRVPTRWRLRFRLQANEWRVTNIGPVPAPFSPIRNWRDVSR